VIPTGTTCYECDSTQNYIGYDDGPPPERQARDRDRRRKGIGRAIVETLHEEGADVTAAARTFDAELPALDRVDAVELDLSEPGAVDALAERTGDVDVVINNLGRFAPRTRGFAAVTDAEWHETLELNLLSAVRMTRAAMPALAARGGGAIVNVSSVRARVPHSPLVDYAAAKAALTNFSKLMADELAPQGIRVNTVSPGPTLTHASEDGPFGRELAAASGVEVQELIDTVPRQAGITIGRLVAAAEVAAVVAFLASPRAAGITGADYRVDGGLLKTV
jgi:putative oxidoreductase